MPANVKSQACSLLSHADSALTLLAARDGRESRTCSDLRSTEVTNPGVHSVEGERRRSERRILKNLPIGWPGRRKEADRRGSPEYLSQQFSGLVTMLQGMRFPEKDAEDAAQEAVLCLLRRLKNGTAGEIGNWDAWLRSAAIGIARRNAKRRLVCDLIAITLAFVTPFDEVERMEEEEKGLAALRDAIKRLPDPLRIVLVYCRINGHTYVEAAREFKVCTGTINRRLNRARALLRDYLRATGIEFPE